MAKGDMDRVLLHTNAPAHWPPMHALSIELRKGTIAESLARSLVKDLGKAGRKDADSVMAPRWLVNEGAVTSSFALLERGVATPVYVYTEVVGDTPGKFAWAIQALQAQGHPAPVYYAPQPIPPSEPLAPQLAFERTAFVPVRMRAIKKGWYSMWWGGPGVPTLESDASLAYLDRAFRAMSGIEPLVLERMGMAASALERDGQLPGPEREFPVSLPDMRYGILAISREKGIRFAFHVDETPVAFRDLFLRHFSEFVERVRAELEARAGPIAAVSDSLRWWLMAEAWLLSGKAAASSTEPNAQRIGNFQI